MLTEKEVLERAFRALDGLAARPAKSQSEAQIPESYTSRRRTPKMSEPTQETAKSSLGSHEDSTPAEPTKEMVTDQAQIDQAGRILAAAGVQQAEPSTLKGQAVELSRDGRRFFLVADDEDALGAIRRFGAHRGEVWTSGELELVATIPDQGARDELEAFKRQLDGCLSPGTAGKGISAAEWQAQMLNQLFKDQGVTGQPARLEAATVKHGERGRK